MLGHGREEILQIIECGAKALELSKHETAIPVLRGIVGGQHENALTAGQGGFELATRHEQQLQVVE